MPKKLDKVTATFYEKSFPLWQDETIVNLIDSTKLELQAHEKHLKRFLEEGNEGAAKWYKVRKDRAAHELKVLNDEYDRRMNPDGEAADSGSGDEVGAEEERSGS